MIRLQPTPASTATVDFDMSRTLDAVTEVVWRGAWRHSGLHSTGVPVSFPVDVTFAAMAAVFRADPAALRWFREPQ